MLSAHESSLVKAGQLKLMFFGFSVNAIWMRFGLGWGMSWALTFYILISNTLIFLVNCMIFIYTFPIVRGNYPKCWLIHTKKNTNICMFPTTSHDSSTHDEANRSLFSLSAGSDHAFRSKSWFTHSSKGPKTNNNTMPNAYDVCDHLLILLHGSWFSWRWEAGQRCIKG